MRKRHTMLNVCRYIRTSTRQLSRSRCRYLFDTILKRLPSRSEGCMLTASIKLAISLKERKFRCRETVNDEGALQDDCIAGLSPFLLAMRLRHRKSSLDQVHVSISPCPGKSQAEYSHSYVLSSGLRGEGAGSMPKMCNFGKKAAGCLYRR